MKIVSELDVKDAIRIILSDGDHYRTSLNYAIHYCEAALHMYGHDLYVQTLYILNNITHWRHPKAKDVRTTLKTFKA
jgi:hypothetical protein